MGRPASRSEAASVSWDLSCPDWEQRLREGRPLVPDLPLLNLDAANKAVAIFRGLRLADVPGTPLVADAGAGWFLEIVRAMFGSLDPTWGRRAIRELFLLVPKKNGKTTYGGLLTLTGLLMNQRPNATFIMTAPDHGVADIAYNAVRGAIELNPVLHAKMHVRDHLKTVVHRDSKSKLQIMTFDPDALTGQKCAGVLMDELHILAKKPKASSAIRQLRGGMLPFPEAFLAFITTQSEETPSAVFKAELTKAREIRDGKRNGAMLPVLYEFPQSMQADPEQWRDPKNWPLVTPSPVLEIPRLVEEFETEEDKGEAAGRAWASQHLNIQIGTNSYSDQWIGAEFWQMNTESGLTLDEVLKRSEVVTIGIDGGGLDDMLAIAVLGRDTLSGKWLLWTHAWIHPIALQRRKSQVARYQDFVKDGDLTIVEMDGGDISQVADIVHKVEMSGKLDRIGVDREGIGPIIDAIVAKGIEVDRIIGVAQGWQLTGAIKTTERRLAEKALLHSGSALNAYAVSNCKIEPRGNAITITKQVSGSAKIDPAMALFDAATLMARNPQPRMKQYQAFFV